MSEKMRLKRCIDALAFAIHELVLFLDTHPYDRKAFEMLHEYRRRRREAIEAYEAKFGKFVETVDDVKPTDYWHWLDSPWPWEKED